MADTIAGFPFWQAEFDKEGHLVGKTAAQFAKDIAAAQLTDLYTFSHGWNNDDRTAQALYSAFFKEVRALIDSNKVQKQRAARIGVMGVFWPSILWPDEVPPALSDEAGDAGGAAAFGAASDAEDVPIEDLKKIFDESQHDVLDKLGGMLSERESNDDTLRDFKETLDALVSASAAAHSKDSERDGLVAGDEDFKAMFKALAEDEPAPESEGGAAGLRDQFATLWNGAKGALRVATYWQMKERAGVVGRTGLGPMLSQIAAEAPDTRLHLIGHSFGARLVSYALAGLANAPEKAWPIKSLLLLQGAFSHFTFAAQLPHDRTRKGELSGMADRVDGPLLTTFSDFDTAVGRAYPLASFAARQDAAKLAVSRWGAMGHDGAQAVEAEELPLGSTGTRYPFATGRWINLDGNRIIKTGGPPSGAHSDIIHPEVGWVTLAAAKIV